MANQPHLIMGYPITADGSLPTLAIDLNLDLPTIPVIMTRIIQALDDDRATARKIEELILHDPSLSAQVLRLANSPLYGFRCEVKTISHAIALLGLNQVKLFVIGVGIFDSFRRGAKTEVRHLNSLWVHSYSVGTISQEIWKRRGDRKESEFAFLCGLLHDVGKVVYFKKAPLHYAYVFSQERTAEDPDLTTAEQEYYGISHGPLGALLAEQWGFPPALCTVIRSHHSTVDLHSPIVASVSLADSMARTSGLGSDGDRIEDTATGRLRTLLNMEDDEYQRLICFTESKRIEVNDFFRVSS